MQLDRRNFLKLSAAATLLAPFSSLKTAEASEVTAVDHAMEKKVNLLCRMCAQFCPLQGTVRDGRLVRIDANPNTPYSGACGRARAAVAALYSPNRIKSPLIRVGERGEGKFRKASWDEAMTMVSQKMKTLRDAGEARSVAFFPRFNSAPGMDKEFFEIYGSPNTVGYGDSCFGNGLQVSLGAVCGGRLQKGVPSSGTTAVSSDYEKAAYGLLIGRNPGGGLVTYTWGVSFGRGKKNGMQVTVVDPRKPSEAGESDSEWLPIRPGTDAAFLLGVMNVIMEKKYYDSKYLLKNTNAAMLVDLETGMPVKTEQVPVEPPKKEVFTATDIVVVPKEEKKEDKKPADKKKDDKKKDEKKKDDEFTLNYLVYDKVKGFVLASETETPELLGSFTVELDGRQIKAKTSLQYMIDEGKQFTPEWAEKICDVPAARIVGVAEKLNKFKPKVFINRGYRSERYASSMREQLLIATMNVLLGCFGVEGGVFWNRAATLKKFIKSEKPKEESVMAWYMKNDLDFKMASIGHYRRVWAKAVLEGKPYPQKMTVFSGQNIVGGSTGGAIIAEALKKMEMNVVISPYFNETAMYADVILPDCTFMERDEILNIDGFKSPVPTIGVNRAAVQPLFDTKDGFWIIMQLAKKVLTPEEFTTAGFASFQEKGLRGVWEKQLSEIGGISAEEAETISLEKLLQKGVWTGKKKYGIRAKGTPTGKLEIYSIYLAKTFNELKEKKYPRLDQASPLPKWTPPFWLEKKAKLSGDEFIPITGFSPLSSFTGAQTRDNLLLKGIGEQIDWDAVFINKGKGKKLGFRDGQLVEIVNPEKPDLKSTARVILSETVHPDAMFCYYGVGAGALKAQGKFLTNSEQIGFNPNHVSGLEFCPLTGGMPAQDFIVKMRGL
jgi:anaerobic selenocysteine-containing dehydrogenase